MTPEQMRDVLRRLESLVDGWIVAGGIPPIERDLALDKLRMWYDALQLAEAPVPAVEEPEHLISVSINLDDVLSVGEAEAESVPEPETPVTAPVGEAEAESVPEPETPVTASVGESWILDKAVRVSVAEPCSAQPEAASKVVSERPKASQSEPAPKPVAPTLFGTDESEDLLRHRHKQRVLMSLYDMEEPSAGPSSAPAPKLESVASAGKSMIPGTVQQTDDDDEMVIEEIEFTTESMEPAEADSEPEFRAEPGVVLGDVINPHLQTLADTLAASRPAGHDTVHGEPVTDLRKLIGINDRFLMIRDLFGGDSAAYDRVIGIIDDFDDFDDCMIYIAENYAWNPNSDGAKLLMELIQRKLA